MFYFDIRINVVDIIISLLIVILTTGITYYLFSVRPSRNRLKILKKRLIYLKNELYENIISNESDFKNSYELYNEEEVGEQEDGKAETWVWSKIDIIDLTAFLHSFRYLTLLDLFYNNYWQGNELMILVNNLVMDDDKYIDLSINLSRLNSNINHTKTLIGDRADNIWDWDPIYMERIIKRAEDNEWVSVVVNSMEDIFETSNKIVELIDKILK